MVIKRWLWLLGLVVMVGGWPGRAAEGGRPMEGGGRPVDPAVMFVENVGQFDAQVRFQVRAGGEVLWLTEEGVWLTLLERAADSSGSGNGVNLKLGFTGANRHTRLEPFGRLETVVSYGGPGGAYWDVPAWGGVRYVDLYPGVDLELGGAAGRWTWRLAERAGRAPRPLPLEVEGAEEMTWQGTSARLETALGLYSLPPLAGQVERPASEEPAGLGLIYSTFAGAGFAEEGNAIAVDSSGRATVAGATATQSPNFSETPGPFTAGHNVDVLILRANAAGSALDYLIWVDTTSTGVEDHALGVGVDSSGSAYVAGWTYSDNLCSVMGSPPGYDPSYNDNGDAFLMKVQANGSGLVYCTFLGGADIDRATAVAVDGAGNATVTGGTWSTGFPTTLGAYDQNHPGLRDVFVTRLNAAGTGLVYSTFVGGTGQDEGTAVDLDAAGNAYATGWTNSKDFVATGGVIGPIHAGGTWDGFVLKLNTAGSALGYSTFLGGNDGDRGWGIAIDAAGSAYVTGPTISTNFPTSTGAYDRTFGGGICSGFPCSDAYLVHISPDAMALYYGTYLGGDSAEEPAAVDVDANGQAYVTGFTASPTTFPVTGNAYDSSHNGGEDVFLSIFNGGGTDLVYSTFLGGSSFDLGGGVWTNGQGSVYLTGDAHSADFPVTPGAYDPSHNGDFDVFVARLDVPVATGSLRLYLPAVLRQ